MALNPVFSTSLALIGSYASGMINVSLEFKRFLSIKLLSKRKYPPNFNHYFDYSPTYYIACNILKTTQEPRKKIFTCKLSTQ